MAEDKIYQQMSLWDLIYPKKIIDKPIRLIEFFAGIGAQHKALKQLTDQVESWKICEWAYNSYCSYNAIHIKDFTDYSQNLSKEELIEKVRGTSTNYNKPLTDKQLKRKPIEWLRNAYNNIKATHNLINIMEVHGKDLEIVDTDKYEYILTYSFPCQDLSLAGKRQGMSTSQKDGGTRSGLLWEVERILGEIAGGGLQLPQILVMENVPEVIGSANLGDFNKWEHRLEELGYKNYVEILNAKNYGIPQNRRRCFMVSILGEYAYNFPIKLKREYQLKDLLEKSAAKKYYLTDEHIERISNWKAQQKPLENAKTNVLCSPTLTARGAEEDHSGMVLIDTELFEKGEVVDFDSSDEFRREHSTEESPTLLTRPKLAVVEKDNDESDGGGIPIVEATKKGYKVAHDGDGVDIGGRMKSHRGTVQKGLAQTIKTDCDVGVVVEDEKPKVIGSYQPNSFCAGQVVDPDGIAPTFLENHGSVMGVIEKDDTKRYKNYVTWRNKKGEFNTECNRASLEDDLALTIPTKDQTKVELSGEGSKLRIRRLTPKECIRLMGFTDEDYEAMRSIGMTDSAIYHMAGDSIVVTVLISIFSQLMYEDDRHKKVVNEYIKKGIKSSLRYAVGSNEKNNRYIAKRYSRLRSVLWKWNYWSCL